MKVDRRLFLFPFEDERWKSKVALGGLLALVAIIVWPLYWVLAGFAVRIMRQTIKGEQPALPEWDNWGGLFGDGVQLSVIGLIYLSPALLLICCGYMVFILGMVPFMVADLAQMSEALGIGGMIAAYGLGFVLFGVGSILALPLGFLTIPAYARWVDKGTLSSAFEFREVWLLLREGFTNYLLAYAVLYGAAFIGSMAVTILMYTIILTCLYPFALALYTFYLMLLMGAVGGMAYYHTQESLSDVVQEGRQDDE